MTKKEGEAPEANVFGDLPEPEAPVEGGETKVEKKEGDADISTHPAFVELKTQFDEYRRVTGENLSGQRELIEKLQRGDKPKEETPALFGEVKRVKDLPEDEQEAMTETEKRLFDQNADMQEAMNRMFSEASKKETEGVEDRNKAVRDMAQRLAKESSGKDDTALANEIIENFNLFDQSKIPADKLEEFVKKAASQAGNYKPPKEQEQPRGGATKGGGKGEDPHNVDSIVEEAHKSTAGGAYAL